MGRYILRRILWLIPTLLAISLVTFVVMHATPGSPLDPSLQGGNTLDPVFQKNMEIKYGLDRPLYEQYARFVWNALQGDFGNSFVYRSRSVGEIIASSLPVSIHLGVMAFIFAVIGGLALGITGALNNNRWPDYATTGLAAVAVSLPNFVIAVLLVLIFALGLHLVPTGGWDAPNQWILPTITLGLGPLAVIARFSRAAVLETLHADYIRTAHAKGLTARRIVFAHVLKNSLTAVITVAGPILAAIGTGSFVIESMFRVPGVGRYFVTSMLGRDYPMIMAVVLIYGTFLAVINIVVDILCGVFDPRIRYT